MIPSAGESVNEAEIVSWSKKSGDVVKMDEVLLELETDKASLELNAEASGELKRLVKEGETVKVGQVVGTIDTSVSQSQKEEPVSTPHKPSAKTSVGERVDITVPAAGESISEGEIAGWKFKSGDYVHRDDVLVEIETDKASLEVTAQASGTLNVKIEKGVVSVGDTLGSILKIDPPKSSTSPPAALREKSSPAASVHYALGHPSPAAQKRMAKKELLSTQVLGSGKDGRILKQDVDELKDASVAIQGLQAPARAQAERTEERQKMTRIRKTIAARMLDAQQSTAMLTTFNEVDMSAVMAIRNQYKEAFKEKNQVGLGFMSFFTKAVCDALKAFPLINARLEEDEIVYHHYCDIGIAVATPKGLVVPVIRDAEKRSFKEIETTIADYATKGRNEKLTVDEMTGGTFTITNGGVFGSMLSTPILNRPQSAILGMHNIVERPIALNGQVVIRPIMYLALTYDHRLIDGAGAVRFLVSVKEKIEDPARLLIGV